MGKISHSILFRHVYCIAKTNRSGRKVKFISVWQKSEETCVGDLFSTDIRSCQKSSASIWPMGILMSMMQYNRTREGPSRSYQKFLKMVRACGHRINFIRQEWRKGKFDIEFPNVSRQVAIQSKCRTPIHNNRNRAAPRAIGQTVEKTVRKES